MLLCDIRQQKVTGTVNLSRCANIALIIYLADSRHVFEAGNAANVILTGNFTFKKECMNEPVFTFANTQVGMTSKSFNDTVKGAGYNVDSNMRCTFRGLRSSCLCQAFIEDTKRMVFLPWQQQKLFVHSLDGRM